MLKYALPARPRMPDAVGVVGTGMLGAAVARRLIGCGVRVVAFNRTPEKAEQLAREGAEAAPDRRTSRRHARWS